MIVDGSNTESGTHISDTSDSLFTDKDGSEIITIECVTPPNPDIEFEMEVSGGTPAGGGGCTTVGTAPTQKGDAVCSVLVNGSFTVVVRLASPGNLSGQVISVQTVVGWTTGLIGPGDSGSTKQISVLNCRGFPVSAAPFLALPQVAGAGCSSFPPPLTDAEATGIRAEFQMNCGPTPSQELITMMDEVLPGSPNTGTFVSTALLEPIVDKDGSEVITIRCAQEVPVLVPDPFDPWSALARLDWPPTLEWWCPPWQPEYVVCGAGRYQGGHGPFAVRPLLSSATQASAYILDTTVSEISGACQAGRSSPPI